MRQKWKTAILLLVVISMLGGCFAEKPVLEELGPEGKGKIKVLYYDEDRQANGTTYEEEYIKHIEKNKPDVLIVSRRDLFDKLAEEGKLYNLEAIIEQEKFDLDGYLPGFADLLRERGGCSLYGLAPYFSTSVIFYNADLFREHHIDLPRNRMSWKELIELASRFADYGSEDEPIYGLVNQYGRVDSIFFDVAESLSLRLFDAKGEKITFNTDGWKEAMELTANAVRGKAVFSTLLEPRFRYGEIEAAQTQNFFKGKVAMVLCTPWFMHELTEYPNYDKEANPIDWGIVTAPVDPGNPDESQYVSLHDEFAILADSPNKRAAWEFVKYVNGPERAKAASRSLRDLRDELPTRGDHIRELDGKSMEPFFMLRPKASSGTVWGGPNVKIPLGFYWNFTNLIKQELRDMIENNNPAEAAVAKIDEEGNAILKQEREREKAEAEKAREKAQENGAKK
ncbi:extracellular solute-binding protein [Paenibacillus thiaminolyticus]|uniref:ABC transporter substrate-binding protein n=1 Tax=Paenibacillus thiaminolyticus TaxID=49283 RepID=UPI0035A6C1CD